MTQLYYALPEIVLLLATCVILLIDLFIKQKRLRVTYALTLLTVIATVALNYSLLYSGAHEVVFQGQYVRDGLTSLLGMLIGVIVLGCLIFSRDYIFEHRYMAQNEFYVLALFSMLGMLVLISAHSLLVIYLGLELMSLPLYALIALKRDDILAVEAAVKYFIMGAIGSGLLLYGTTFIYGMENTIDIAHLGNVLQNSGTTHPTLVLATIFVIAGIGFKLAAVPFHMWAPDVYQGAPNGAAMIVSTAPKLAAFALVMRYLVTALGAYHVHWQAALIVLAVLSMGLGNILALVQSNIKRLIAYSGIAHIGYMLLGIIAYSNYGYASALFYMIIYAFSTLGAFGILTMLSSEKHEFQTIHDFRGLHHTSPWLAFMMLLVVFSMAGIPPLAGFFAKLVVIESAIHKGFVWLGVVAIVFSIIGLYYYLNIVKTMYFERPVTGVPIIASNTQKIVLTLNCVLLLAFGIAPAGLVNLAHDAIAYSF